MSVFAAVPEGAHERHAAPRRHLQHPCHQRRRAISERSTAIFAANGYLLAQQSPLLLTAPFDEADPSLTERFNDLLARFYVFGEDEPVSELLLGRGVVAKQCP
ncbi:hypothetical protein [Corynebacterium coyleae]|uniref:Uncharacterized protein n=1 Tax=Corynebacterium coyleae TaxID=53374 RepID=A0AAP7CCS5_9CORY|nr:hypothetical protein [Corynebacterium coyleae]NJJ04430.1 hypothetical protein [Corynebacterium coyleae]